ncbi:MAG: DUF2007 domain-containing protein [Gammaproteobacteria bacterium]|nr:DUF2007 domain-containing protein [Gammaproteobacteria bacterium]
MKQVYIAANLPDAHMCKDYLESFSMPVIIKGEFLTGAAGELPVNAYPSVWVVDERDYELALTKVKIYERHESVDQLYDNDWLCEQCGERIEAQFTQCWQCGNQRNQ